MATVFQVPPSDADWYYCATIDVSGDTDYVDGYASGDKPTRTGLQEYSKCRHVWVAGMMYVDDEDVESVAAVRPVQCEKCDCTWVGRNAKPLKIVAWEVKATPSKSKGTE